MDPSDALREIVASFLKIEPATVTGDYDLRKKLQNSVARGGLDAVIRRRLKKVCPEVYTARTYGQLAAAILGEAPPDGAAAGSVPANSAPVNGTPSHSLAATNGIDGAFAGVECGVDAECPGNLPLENDYWESDFYRAHFTPREIAYCVEQEDPRQHFAARWCAKEALKKCDPSLRELEMHRLEVVPDERGKPHFWLVSETGPTPLAVSVSLTHTAHLALAFVVQVRGESNGPQVSATADRASTEQVQSPSPPDSLPEKKGWVSRLFGG